MWENLGWHYYARKRHATVGPALTGDPRTGEWTIQHYTATVHTSGRQFMAHGIDPRDALGHVVQDARTCIERMKQELDDLLD